MQSSNLTNQKFNILFFDEDGTLVTSTFTGRKGFLKTKEVRITINQVGQIVTVDGEKGYVDLTEHGLTVLWDDNSLQLVTKFHKVVA